MSAIDRARTPKTPVSEAGGEPSWDNVLSAAVRFGLKATDAKAILFEVSSVASGWREVGRKLRIKASTLDAYATAFDHTLMTEALKLSCSTSIQLGKTRSEKSAD